MLPLPRLALGAVQPGASHHLMLWAMIEALRQQGLQLQTFSSRAAFVRHRMTGSVAGSTPRHLDSWLMTPELCREIFLLGTEACDLAIVEGQFRPGEGSASDALGDDNGEKAGGSLETLCEWLDLPRLAVLDVVGLGETLPEPPAQIDGVLLDRVDSGSRLTRLAVDIETQWEVPVLGSLGSMPELRDQFARTSAGGRPDAELCRQLGLQFQRSGEPERIVEIASRRPMNWARPAILEGATPPSDLTVALAYDDAINCYFPDALDLLEIRGATIIDFSPLRDERLPKADVVYLGCGHPEQMAAALAGNECMRFALRQHVREGGRVYAEGGGMAYLCQLMESDDGVLHRTVGLLPAVARLNRDPAPPSPVAGTLTGSCWLGGEGESVRGYLSDRWRLEPVGELPACLAESDRRWDLNQCCRVIGSRIHVDIAAQLHLLHGFFQPAVDCGDRFDPW